MRPIYLKIAGLNSFRERQEVDFTQLGESGVFGIFGPTGSGKSTVLDAVTLALYGKVERAKGGTQGIINQNEAKAYVYFAFQIGTRKFIAERTYKKGNDGSVTQNSCRLAEDGPDGLQVIAEKKREMDEQVRNILGLTVEDFTRAVVLPQGKFQEFLTLQGAERRKMLQRIFALEKYGEKLTQRIRDRLLETRLKENTLESRQKELGDASLETLQSQEKILNEAELVREDLAKQGEAAEKARAEYKQILDLQTEHQKTAGELEKLTGKDDEFTAKKARLDKALKAERLKPFMEIRNKELNQRDRILKKLTLLEKEAAAAKLAYDEAEKMLFLAQDQLNDEGEKRKQEMIKLEEALSIEERKDELEKQREKLLNEYQSRHSVYKTLVNNISHLKEQRGQFKERQQKVARDMEVKNALVSEEEEVLRQKEAWLQLQEIRVRFAEFAEEKRAKEKNFTQTGYQIRNYFEQAAGINKQLARLEDKLNSLTQPEMDQLQLNTYREQLANWEKELITLKHYYDLDTAKQQEIAGLNTKRALLEAKLQEKNALHDQLRYEKEKIFKELTALERNIKEKELSNYAQILREQLADHKPCPVCGSLEHPNLAVLKAEREEVNILRHQLAAGQETFAKLEANLQNVCQECSQLSMQISNFQEALRSCQEEREALQAQRERCLPALPGPWRTLAITEMEAKQQEALEFFKNRQQELEEFLKTKEKLGAEIEKVKSSYIEQNILLKQAEAKAESIKEDLTLLYSREETLVREQKEKEDKFKRLARGQQGEAILKKYEDLRAAKQALENLRREEKKIIDHSEQVSDELQAKNDEALKLQQILETIKLEGQNCSSIIQELTDKLNKITKGRRVQEAKRTAEAELQLITVKWEKSLNDKEQQRQAWEENKTLLYSSQQELKQVAERIKGSEEELSQRLADLNFYSLGEAESYLAAGDEINLWRKEIDEYGQAVAFARKNLAVLQDKLAGRSISPEEWQEFMKNKIHLEEVLALQVQKVHNFTYQLKIRKENHERWNELERQRQVIRQEIDRLFLLEKLFKGNTFVEFMAEEQLLHVALDASRRLGELTNYRYALELDSEGGFIIRDDANGGLRRPVATLSGGETFLTSLSLALALSSQIQLRGQFPLEFFFLDEGFGTLDSYLLETVMNSLERLHTEKMTIGIISHVPELRARMARSLLVEPAEKGGRGTRLCVSLA
ncbi:MAG: AAA family ATPase [Peptococcaceae bacterium]